MNTPEELPKHRREQYRLLGPERIFPESSGLFSPDTFSRFNDQDKLEMINWRTLLLNICDVKNLTEIPSIFNDEIKKSEINEKLIDLYTSMLGLKGSLETRKHAVNDALLLADSAMSKMENPQTGLLRELRTEISMNNEVAIIDNPTDLLLLTFSEKATPKARFEARRKLVLADQALRIQMHTEGQRPKMDKFTRFLNTHIWSGDKLGKLQEVEILSHHSPLDFHCNHVQILEPEEKVDVSEFVQYHKFQMRPWTIESKKSFKQNGVKLAMVEHRQKDPVDYLIKLLRKDSKDPSAVDDVLGLKLTFLKKSDIFEFLQTLQEVSNRTGSMITFEDPYDTIENKGDFRITNPGSSDQLEIVKVHLFFQGTRYELQMHTLRSYLDSRYKDDIGFEEFSLKRLFEKGEYDTSVIEMLYPPDIYGFNIIDYYPELLAYIRESKRIRSHFLPPERAKDNKKRIRYSEHDLAADTMRIIEQMTKIPDLIISAGSEALPLAKELSDRLSSPKIVVSQDPDNDNSLETEAQNILIVDDIGDRCEHITSLINRFPYATVAVIAKRPNEISNSLVNYHGRTLEKDEWLNFSWERIPKKYDSLTVALGLIHKSTPKGLNFLVLRLKNGKLKLPGGKKEPFDIDLDRTIQRELAQELSFQKNIPPVQRVGDAKYHYEDNTVYPTGLMRCYEISWESNQPITPNDSDVDYSEIKGTEWVSAQELIDNIHPTAYKEALMKFLKMMITEHQHNQSSRE